MAPAIISVRSTCRSRPPERPILIRGLPRVAADDRARRHADQPRIDTAGSISPDDAWEGGGAFIVEINGEDIDGGTTAPALRF